MRGAAQARVITSRIVFNCAPVNVRLRAISASSSSPSFFLFGGRGRDGYGGSRRSIPFPGGMAELSFTARVQRGPSEAARCASTKDTQPSRSHPCFLQQLTCIGPLRLRNLFRRPFGHDFTTSIATLRAEIDDPIGILDHVEIMFDYHQGVAGFDEPIEHVVRHSPVVVPSPRSIARIIHERFCCNCGFAATTRLDAVSPASRQAGSPLGRSTYCFKYASLPHGSSRLSRLATARFRDEPS
jgi:hypothetical protein